MKEIDYGVLGDISKGINCSIFGDCSGSTISRRTTKGFKKTFNLSDMNISDQGAEHIVHGLMIGTVASFASNKKNSTLTGLLLLAGLTFMYHNKKKTMANNG